MGSRLLPLLLALAAIAADAAGLDRIAVYVVLGTVVGAAGAAFASVGDALAGRSSRVVAGLCSAALALVLLGSAVRAGAAIGAGVPVLATSTLVAAVVLYALPALAWVLEPLARPRALRSPISSPR